MYRSQGYKKKMVDEKWLIEEARFLRPYFERFENQLSGADLLAAIIIAYLNYRYPKNWLQSQQQSPSISFGPPLKDLGLKLSPNILKRISPQDSIGSVISSFTFMATPLAVNHALQKYALKQYPLILMKNIPSPKEVLLQQAQGKRCVTYFTNEGQMNHLVLGERDPLSFLMHDLIHADHFFHESNIKQGQIGFYRQVLNLLEKGSLNSVYQEDRFEYLISDMNAYCVHLWKGLKSIALEHFDDILDYLEADLETKDVLRRLNTPAFQEPEDTLRLEKWCVHY